MPNINLRLTELEHAELREWAHGSRRSLQREIVFRLFDGAVTERDQGRREVESGLGAAVPDLSRGSGSTAPLSSAGDSSPRSVTVPPVVRDVAVERSSSRNGCGFDTPKGTKCKLCGSVH